MTRLPLSLFGFFVLKCGFHAFSVQQYSRAGEWIAVLLLLMDEQSFVPCDVMPFCRICNKN